MSSTDWVPIPERKPDAGRNRWAESAPPQPTPAGKSERWLAERAYEIIRQHKAARTWSEFPHDPGDIPAYCKEYHANPDNKTVVLFEGEEESLAFYEAMSDGTPYIVGGVLMRKGR
ncbi:MAG TPA: hypothetical protein VHW66_09340 [Stellaceae bacterium]|jgi:hypothetical protein|nr:hypothetical protein [Stellaceae bacterium]